MRVKLLPICFSLLPICAVLFSCGCMEPGANAPIPLTEEEADLQADRQKLQRLEAERDSYIQARDKQIRTMRESVRDMEQSSYPDEAKAEHRKQVQEAEQRLRDFTERQTAEFDKEISILRKRIADLEK